MIHEHIAEFLYTLILTQITYIFMEWQIKKRCESSINVNRRPENYLGMQGMLGMLLPIMRNFTNSSKIIK